MAQAATYKAATYNQRLFSGGMRGKLHNVRFTWLMGELRRLECPYDSVLELGCYDGKLIEYFPKPPSHYYGYDANWEDGLDLARERWGHMPQYKFYQCTRPSELELPSGAAADIAVVMETMEHIPPELVDGFLRKLAAITPRYLFITVPNEKGLVFAAKRTAKRLFGWRGASQYTWTEVFNATFGRVHLVPRDEHKGFDYDALVRQVGQYFDIVRVSGMPFGSVPRWLGFGVGIVAKPKVSYSKG